VSREAARAALLLGALEAEIAAAGVARRLGRGGSAAEALGGGAWALGQVADPDAHDGRRAMTGVGWLTARRRGPGALSTLELDTPLVRAAEGYLAAAEAVASSGPGALAQDGGRGGGVSDGGAVSRCAAAARWRAMREAVGDDLVFGARAGAEMRMLGVVDAVVLGGASLSAVVRASGRAPNGRSKARVGAALVIGLDRLAGWWQMPAIGVDRMVPVRA